MLNQLTYKGNGFEFITTNPQRTFYYRLTELIEVWGNYHAQIAFYDRHNRLIYHRQGCFAHALSVDSSIEFAKWSETGNEVLFYEYKRGYILEGGICHYVLIDLINKNTYRIDLYKYGHEFLDKLQEGFTAIDTIKKIEELGIEKELCFTDEITISPLMWLAGIDKWKPDTKL